MRAKEKLSVWSVSVGGLDVTVGLYYYRLRYYDPVAGRFVSRDPLGLWGDQGQRGNGQSYCGANPVNSVDPFGLEDSGLGDFWDGMERIKSQRTLDDRIVTTPYGSRRVPAADKTDPPGYGLLSPYHSVPQSPASVPGYPSLKDALNTMVVGGITEFGEQLQSSAVELGYSDPFHPLEIPVGELGPPGGLNGEGIRKRPLTGPASLAAINANEKLGGMLVDAGKKAGQAALKSGWGLMKNAFKADALQYLSKHPEAGVLGGILLAGGALGYVAIEEEIKFKLSAGNFKLGVDYDFNKPKRFEFDFGVDFEAAKWLDLSFECGIDTAEPVGPAPTFPPETQFGWMFGSSIKLKF